MQGVLSSRGRRILMADADGASKFADLARLERALDDLSGKVSVIYRLLCYVFNPFISSQKSIMETRK